MAIGAKLTTVSDYLFRRLFKLLFRYDIFISYARRDGKGYALKLKEQLTRLDFSCFLDYDELPAGNSLNRTLKRAIKRSATIIVVGTEGALKSRYVELEVGEFASTGRAIIPIDFEGTLAGAPWAIVKERDLVWVDETKDALAKNVPSPPVADAVDKLFKYTRRNVRVRGQVIATAALFLLGAAVSVLVIWHQVAVASEQTRAAEDATAQAEQRRKEAVAATNEANRQTLIAETNANTAQQKAQEAKEKTEEAREKTEEASKQGEIARKQTAEAQKQATIARAKAEEARQQQLFAEQQQKVASSRELAANAVSQLQIDPELSLVLAGKSAEADHTFEAEDALRRSLLESHVRAAAEGHRGEVTRASFTPDGEFVVATGADNTAQVLRLSDGQVVAQLRGHTKPLRSAAFSPNGKFVVTASDDKTARLWDWRENRMILELPHPDAVSGARFSPDGAAIITTSDDNAARVWDVKTRQRLAPPLVLYGIVAKEYHGSKTVEINPFSPDGRHVFFVPLEAVENQPGGAEDEEKLPGKRINVIPTKGRESVWDVSTGRVLPGLENLTHLLSADINVEHNLMVAYLKHPKGNGPTELWDLSSGRRFAVIPGADVNGVALSPDGKFVVTANSDNTARVWEVPENRESGGALKSGGVNESGSAGKNDSDVDSKDDSEAQVLDKPRWVLSGHRGSVQSAAFSPDGRFILTASDDRTARVWDVKTGREVSVLRGHRRGVQSAAFSPNGSLMVTAGDDGVARVWDAGMGQGFIELSQNDKVKSALFGARSGLVLTTDEGQTARLWDAGTGKSLPHTWTAHDAALSPDGKMIVTASQESPRIYDAATGRVRLELSGQGGEALGVAYSPDGRFVATAEFDKVVRVRDAETGRVLKELPAQTWAVTRLLFSPADGDLLLTTGGQHAQISQWKTETPPVVLQNFSGSPDSGVFSPDGRLVAGLSGSTAGVWDARTGCRLKIRMPHKSPVLSAVFGPDGHSLLSVDPNAAKLWQLPATLRCEGPEETLKESIVLDHSHAGSFAKQMVLVSPDSKFIVLTGGREVQVLNTDAPTGTLRHRLQTGPARVPGAALNSDGKLIVTASEDGNARVWDSGTGKLLRTLEGSRGVPLSAASFSLDDRLIVTVSDPRFNIVTVWDAATGQPLGENLHGRSASFSPDSKSVLTLSGGDVARISDVSDGRAFTNLQGLTGRVTYIAFSDDGKRVMAATSDRRVGVWQAASGRNLARREYAGDLMPVALSHDGKLIATTDSNRLAQVWDTEADKVSQFGKEGDADSVALSPDGRFLLVTMSSEPVSTKVWDIGTGREVTDLPGYSAVFSTDGSRLLTVSKDMARVWDAATWGLLAELRGHGSDINSAAFSPDGKLVVTASKDMTALVWDAETGAVETGLFGDINYGLSSAAFSPGGESILVVGEDQTARLYACVMCGGLAELITRARERFARHPRPLTPDEQKKFTRQTLPGVAGLRPAGLAAP
jgi:WD40 repeat protein